MSSIDEKQTKNVCIVGGEYVCIPSLGSGAFVDRGRSGLKSGEGSRGFLVGEARVEE